MIEAGISATLIKPVDLSTLRQTLHEWLQAGGANQNSIHYRPMSVAPVFDTQLALKIANQRPQLAIEMLALFMQSLDTDQKSLRQAHSDNDLKRFSQQIHRLNGAARFCGIPRIQVLLHDMETLLKTHPELKNELTHELTKTMQQLHIELNSLRDWYQITANPLATNAKASNQLSNNT
jgi:two-component system sensor histidine kinase BarA